MRRSSPAPCTTRAAFATIFDRHHDAIHGFLRRRLDAAIAEDLAAETFARALHGRRALRPTTAPTRCRGSTASPRTSPAATGARSSGACARTRGTGVDPLADDHGDAPARLDAAAAGPRLAAALAALRPDDRDALLLLAWAEPQLRRDRRGAEGPGRDRALAPAPRAAGAARPPRAGDEAMIDELEQLRELPGRSPRPHAGGPRGGPGTAAASPRAVAARHGAPCSASPPPPSRRPPPSPWSPGLDEGQVTPAPANAREALRRVADVAARRTGPGIPRDDQYFYVASEGTELTVAAPTSDPAESYSYLYTKRREIWLSVDRTGLLRQQQVGAPRWLTPRDRANWIRAGRPDEGGGPGGDAMAMEAIHHYFIGDEKFTAAQLRDFDPTPEQLYERLRSRINGRGQSPNGEVFVEIADALRESPQTPQLRATLYRALALVPGVQLLGDVHDRLGRDAIGVAFTEHTGLRQELLLDPETAEALNEREVVAHRRARASAPRSAPRSRTSSTPSAP